MILKKNVQTLIQELDTKILEESKDVPSIDIYKKGENKMKENELISLQNNLQKILTNIKEDTGMWPVMSFKIVLNYNCEDGNYIQIKIDTDMKKAKMVCLCFGRPDKFFYQDGTVISTKVIDHQELYNIENIESILIDIYTFLDEKRLSSLNFRSVDIISDEELTKSERQSYIDWDLFKDDEH